jgi:hypothetical protein
MLPGGTTTTGHGASRASALETLPMALLQDVEPTVTYVLLGLRLLKDDVFVDFALRDRPPHRRGDRDPLARRRPRRALARR